MAVITEEAGTAVGWGIFLLGIRTCSGLLRQQTREATMEQFSRPVAGLTLPWPSEWVVLLPKVLSM